MQDDTHKNVLDMQVAAVGALTAGVMQSDAFRQLPLPALHLDLKTVSMKLMLLGAEGFETLMHLALSAQWETMQGTAEKQRTHIKQQEAQKVQRQCCYIGLD